MKIVRNILAVLVGAFIGGKLNMYIIGISADVIALPPGIDPNDMVSLQENIHLFEPINFLMPFLAHALGTLVGALITGLIAYNHKMKLALINGLLFIMGGIMMVFMLPSPMWFNITDLTLAYFPMAWIGGWIALKITAEPQG